MELHATLDHMGLPNAITTAREVLKVEGLPRWTPGTTTRNTKKRERHPPLWWRGSTRNKRER